MTYLAITTCAPAHWLAYGRAMVQTFVRSWPAEVSLRIYTEGFNCEIEGVEAIGLDAAAPWLAPWKAARSKQERGLRPKSGKSYDFKWDAVRFSHKVAAIGAAAEQTDANVLIWLDADIVTHSAVTVEWLDSLFPPPADIAWLDRANKYPECGFMMFRLPAARDLIREIVAAYQTGAIFQLPQTHDSYVIQHVVNAAVARGQITVASLSGDAREGHVFCAGPLGAKMDHLKGTRRKQRGKSFQSDLLRPRPEPYWR